jgi:hypothetical protein
MELNLKFLVKHKLSDVIKIYWLQLKNQIHYYAFRKGNIYKIEPPINYKEVQVDDFTKGFNTNTWRYAMPWGDFHPDNLTQWYDTDGSLSYSNDQGLNLDLKIEPKTYIKKDLPDWRQVPQLPDVFTIPVGIGFVSTKKAWKYGWFEAWIKLPIGQHYWTAFWMSGLATWPPEIDIFEAYSHISPVYGGNKITKLPNRNIRPNLHYGKVENGTKDQYLAYNVPVAECTERFVQYVCHWEKDFIRIYYDGQMVFECTDTKILDWYNKENASQYVIISHGLHKDYPQNPDESTMLVKSFKVLQNGN